MVRVRLERVRRERNEARFHEWTVSQDLFSWWLLEHRWGRIGTEGTVVLDGFDKEAPALARLRFDCLPKLREKYSVVSDSAGLLPPVGVPPSLESRRLLVADELERLARTLPDPDSRFRQIVGSLASACRRTGRSLAAARSTPRARAGWALDDTEFRIRARIFQLLDELITGALGPEDAERIAFRLLQDPGSAAGHGDVVGFVPRTLWATLDEPVEDAFAGDRALGLAAVDLARAGICTIGALVNAPFDAVLDALGGRRERVAVVEERLMRLGLRLGARTPGWKRRTVGRTAG